jgi:ATP-dependent helicase HrpB
LLAAPQFAGQRILLLEPRRVAARAIAGRLAMSLGEQVGETVGYRIRQDAKVSRATRLEVITEGILTRMLQADAELPGVGIVLFDEFHERSLHSDLGLALALDAQQHLRPDLRLLVMSATLDLPALTGLLGGAPVVSTAATEHRVDIRWRGRPEREVRIEQAMADALRDVLLDPTLPTPGDVLAFLPGVAEIERTRTALQGRLPASVLAHLEIAPLYGDLPLPAQERALAPAEPGMRKVVLATDIAQTSLTLPGVRVVVDSGLARVPRFDPGSGMSVLDTVNVSRASATQRAGRAGRVASGICVRLWSAEQHERLAAHDTPAIQQSDLAPLALELAAWGTDDARTLCWLDVPNEIAWAQGRALLAALGALDAADAPDRAGRITPHGRALLGFAAHPRLAHMLLRAGGDGVRIAADLAALLEERDPLRVDERQFHGVDIEARLAWLRSGSGERQGMRMRMREVAARHVDACRRRAQPGTRADATATAVEPGALLALAYPDRVARRRDGKGGRYLLANGRGAVLPNDDALARSEWIAVAHLDGDGREARIRLAAALDEASVLALFADQLRDERTTAWDDATSAVQTMETRWLGAIRVRARRVATNDDAELQAALMQALQARGVAALPLSDAARTLRQRLACLHHHAPEQWPRLDDDQLSMRFEEWLGPWLTGARRLDDVARIDFVEALLGLLAAPQRQSLPRLAPTHVSVPSGSNIPIDYADPAQPVLAVRIQEVFGLARTPTILDGRVPLTMHLLSPAHRPMQVTRDLSSFWANGYAEVRRELRTRYPRHPWPEDPTTAPATRRAKPRGT